MDALCRRIRDGKVIPLISNTVYGDRIFNISTDMLPGETPHAHDEALEGSPALSVDEQLAIAWAQQIHYPFPDKHQLGRVAQYCLTQSNDHEEAKSSYLAFLKEALLNLVEQIDPQVRVNLAELRGQLSELTFAELVNELDYPRFATPDDDALGVLARLPLPIYVTTSYYDFMERALRRVNKQPLTQICFWRGRPINIAPEHRPQLDFIPSPERPLVFHLHGYEKYPATLVLSEDDYLDFLVRIMQDHDVTSPLIPLYLREELAASSLLLLGYRLQDWDFRTLFQGLILPKHDSLRLFSLALQLTPSRQDGIDDVTAAIEYLEKYFEPAKFKVRLCQVEEFVKDLWQAWNRWRRGA